LKSAPQKSLPTFPPLGKSSEVSAEGTMKRFVVSLALAGCAHQPHGTVSFGPAQPAVRLVGRAPRSHYHFLGVVSARASDEDFVTAAATVRARLRQRALLLGADSVKICAISPGGRTVSLSARAYRSY
jgi:hypothetical protein